MASTAPAQEAVIAVHCRAVGKRGLHSIGILQEQLVDLLTQDSKVLVFAFHRELARLSLLEFHRDGTPSKALNRHTAMGEPKSPVLTSDAAYFTRNRTLYRMPRDSAPPVELAKGFSHAIAVQGGYVYGVSCDAKDPKDRLHRVSTTGGPVQSVVEIERTPPNEQDSGTFACDYRSLVADDEALYATHWNGRRVLRIGLGDQKITTLATKTAFADHLQLQGEQLYYQSSSGLHRGSKTQAGAVRIAELGVAPYGYVAYGRGSIFIHNAVPYASEEWTYELPDSTGKAKKLEHFKVINPDGIPEDVGVRGLAVDDECLYTARQLEKHIAIYARQLP